MKNVVAIAKNFVLMRCKNFDANPNGVKAKKMEKTTSSLGKATISAKKRLFLHYDKHCRQKQ